MQTLKSNFSTSIWAIFRKDLLCEFRSSYSIATLIMFALTALSSVSMTNPGVALSPDFAASLLWVVLFFCAMAGLSRVFVNEQESGTLIGLRMYASGQAVFIGKFLFNLLLLLFLSCFVIPLFVLFFNIDINDWLAFIKILILGCTGIAAVSTLMAAIVIYTHGKQAIFTVITFPILLPQFLCAVNSTVKVFSGLAPEGLLFMFGYNLAVLAAGLLLFDYIWHD
ncbi:heme exporter protein CcmB [Dendrosporobacter sp. 1207_IL3150]|uniref:heme exporter protein CcmB n=1 Tax=Dendrosporobacter sp. 1207_IL3150 TaxID=3084054 RepID=UPI002FDA7E33